jgi:HSP20 family protein
MNDLTTAPRNGLAHDKAYHRRSVSPPMDVFENADELLLVADVPGVSATGLDVRVENDMLTVEAKRAAAKDVPPALAREYDEVDFTTRVRIPAGIDTANISAEAKNGTLVVRMPKAAAAKSRKIVVRSR